MRDDERTPQFGFDSEARWNAAMAAVLSLAASIAVGWISGVPFEQRGVFFDGHLYTEIARSFPLPYPAESHLYAGQAPGYPAVISAVRLILPDSWVNWAAATLLASWLGAAASAAAFNVLCRAWGVRSFWPSVLFVLANPRWLAALATGHSETVAMFFAIASLIAFRRERIGWSLALLAVATLCRFSNLLLVAALAVGLLVERHRRDRATLLWLCAPGISLAVWHVYLAARIPEFTTIWHAHKPFWNAKVVLPFTAFLEGDIQWPRHGALETFTVALLIFYLVAIVLSSWPTTRRCWVFPVWICATIGLPLCLSGPHSVGAFVRLTLMAWPVALLSVWLVIGERQTRWVVAPLAAALGLVSFDFAPTYIADAATMQTRSKPHIRAALGRLDFDEPRWMKKPTPFERALRARRPRDR